MNTRQRVKNIGFLIAMLLLGIGIFSFETWRRRSQALSFRAQNCIASILQPEGPIEAYVPIFRETKSVTVTDPQLKRKVGELLRWWHIEEMPRGIAFASGGTSIEIVRKGTREPFIQILGPDRLLIGYHQWNNPQNEGAQYLCRSYDTSTIDQVAKLLGVEWPPEFESDQPTSK
jgi:hypothetical protein